MLRCRQLSPLQAAVVLSSIHQSSRRPPTSMLECRRHFIEDSKDVFQYRNQEANQVRKENNGVPLGSSQVLREQLRTEQQKMVDDDKMTDWNAFYRCAAVFLVLYTAATWSVEYGSPYQPTEYTPYESGDKKAV